MPFYNAHSKLLTISRIFQRFGECQTTEDGDFGINRSSEICDMWLQSLSQQSHAFVLLTIENVS